MAHSVCWAIVIIADIATLQGLSEGHLFSLLKRNELKCAHWALIAPYVRDLQPAGKGYYQSR